LCALCGGLLDSGTRIHVRLLTVNDHPLRIVTKGGNVIAPVSVISQAVRETSHPSSS
jgi:hypothetical protein